MMIKHRNRFSWLAVGILLAAALAGCSSDSPSEPTQDPAPPPGTAPPSGTFIINVTADPALLQTGGDEPATIRVEVRRADNGQVPPNNTTIALSTTLGDLGSPFSGVRSVALSLINGVAEVLLYPGLTEGATTVQARLENSIGQVRVEIRGSATFFLSFVEPSVGSPQGGDTVTIVGGGFLEPVRVTFAGVVAQVRSVSADRIRVVTPPSSAAVAPGNTLPVSVTVTVNLNETDQKTDTLVSGFVYAPGGGSISQPQVFSLSPASGVNEGGTRVRIRGDGFEAPVQVFFGAGGSAANFNGVEATVESVTRTEIVVVTPAATGFGQGNQNQLVDVLVRNVNSGFATVASGSYRYGSSVLLTGVGPDEVIFDSQEQVLIFGQGFEAPVTVEFAGIRATVLSVTGSEIVTRSPVALITDCNPVTGPVSVVNLNSGAGDASDSGEGPMFDFTFRPLEPIITGVGPSSGPGVGNTTVTISGASFDEPVRVFFGNTAGSVISVSADGMTIRVTSPPFSQFEEEPCDDNGDGTQGMRFVPTAVDIEVTNLVTDCVDLFGGAFTYLPADISCRGDMGAPPPTPTPQCSDGIDNDGDGFSDHASINPINPDPECTGPNDDDESM